MLSAGEVRVYTIAGNRDVARAVRSRVLAECLKIPEEGIAIELGPKGKPLLRTDPTVHFSVSHAGDVSMLAVTRVGPVGIDVELIRTVPHAEMVLRRFFPPDAVAEILSADDREFRFVRAWTAAEAKVKLRGASVWEAATPDPLAVVRAIDAPDGYAASVALRANDWYVTQLPYHVDGVSSMPPTHE